MPLLFQRELPSRGEYAVWNIQESEDYFRPRLTLADLELVELNRIKGEGKRIEWLSSRYLLHRLSGRTKRGILVKDKFGKPHLQHSPFQISLSHSNDRCAVMAAPYNIGIDIQKKVAKIERKAYGRKELDFRNHLFVTPINNIGQNSITTATIQKGDYRKDYHIQYEIGDDYIIVLAAEIPFQL